MTDFISSDAFHFFWLPWAVLGFVVATSMKPPKLTRWKVLMILSCGPIVWAFFIAALVYTLFVEFGKSNEGKDDYDESV